MSPENNSAPLILAVDDTAFNLVMLSNILTDGGYRVMQTSSGEEAIEIADKTPPNLILLDVTMPGMDGYETCQLLKASAETKDIPVIFLSGRTDEEDVVKGLRSGGVDYVGKPFQPSELLHRVRTHLELSTKSAELKHLSQEYRELLQMICHDLTNPLSFIKYVFELEKDQPELFESMKGDIEKAADMSLSIIEMARNLRKITETEGGLSLEAVGLHRAVEESLYMLKQKLDAKNLTLSCKIGKEIQILAEKTAFVNTVMNNLLTNAIKFSHEGAEIVIEASESANSVELTIKDSGIGMSERLLSDLFDISKATHRKGTKGEDGTGYGIPLVKRFVTALGGKIEVTSQQATAEEEQSGTTVRLTLQKPADQTA